MLDFISREAKTMSIRAEDEEKRNLSRILLRIGIDAPDHSALADRTSLGRYLINLPFPKLRAQGLGMEEWREQRRAISHAGVETLREALKWWRSQGGGAATKEPAVEEAEGSEAPSDIGSEPPEAKTPHAPEAEAKTPRARGGGEGNDAARDGSDPEDEARTNARVGSPPDGKPSRPVGARDNKETAPEELLAGVRANAPPPLTPVIEKMESLALENRFVEAFRAGIEAFDKQCEEPYVDVCLCISMMSSRWDRDAHIAPYSLIDHYEALGAAFGKHVHEMRHIDSDPLRATSGLYRMATKIYFSWIDHCAAILEHQHRRTNNQWIQIEWVPTHKFNCLLAVMRSAVRIKLPLDLLFRIYQRLHQVVGIGKAAIAVETRKIKFEGDCLRTLASPSKDLIPDLCYLIYRDIIDTYVKAGENASALMFCDQALLLRRGDHEVESIKAAIISKSGRQGGVAPQRAARRSWIE